MDDKLEYKLLYEKWSNALDEFYYFITNLSPEELNLIENKIRVFILFKIADNYKSELDNFQK